MSLSDTMIYADLFVNIPIKPFFSVAEEPTNALWKRQLNFFSSFGRNAVFCVRNRNTENIEYVDYYSLFFDDSKKYNSCEYYLCGLYLSRAPIECQGGELLNQMIEKANERKLSSFVICFEQTNLDNGKNTLVECFSDMRSEAFFSGLFSRKGLAVPYRC